LRIRDAKLLQMIRERRGLIMTVHSVFAKKWPAILALIFIGVLVTTAAWAAPIHDRLSAPQAEGAAVVPVIPYQGRLLDPSTGEPKADGTYAMTFRIYDAASSGNILWTETKDVGVSQGLFFTYLGDVTGLNPAFFDGGDRWLGVKVEADAETTPHMRLGFAPYAFWSVNADTLDGQDSSAFAPASHNHDDRYINTAGPDFISGNDAEAILIVEQTGSGPAIETTGGIHTDSITYNTARTHHVAIPGEAFQPGSNVNYVNTYGSGGAYIDATGFQALVAPVYPPDGANVVKVTAYFYDASSGDITARLSRLGFAGGYGVLGEVNSSGTSGYQNVTDTTIDMPTIDNTSGGYQAYVYSNAWDGNNLRIMGMVITYIINEAP